MSAISIPQMRSRMLPAARPPQEGNQGAASLAEGRAAKILRRTPIPLRLVMAIPVVALVAGCQERLAQRDAYFAPLSGLSTSLHAETEQTLHYHQALQAALLECGERQDGAVSASGSGSGNTAPEGRPGSDAHARLCASSGAAHAAHGGPLNGYRRWVDDKVRELPAPTETASSIGGGS